MSFTNLLIVMLVAFLSPLVVNLVRRLRLPAVVLEIVAGIVIGPSVLGWVRVDAPIQVLSQIGLAILLFLAGLEIDFKRLRGRLLQLTGLAMLVSLGLALAVGFGLGAVGLVQSPLLVAVILVATGLGLIVPVLADAGQIESDFGQVVIAGATLAEFVAITLLSLFFSQEAPDLGAKLVLLGGFALLAVVAILGLPGSASRCASRRCSSGCKTPPPRSASASPCCC